MDIQNGKSESQLTSLSEEHHVSHSVSLDLGKELMIQGEALYTGFANWCGIESQDGLFGKMSKEFCLPMEEETLVPSSGRWLNSGIISAGECLTLNTLDCPIEEKESSLLGIIQTEQVDTKFYLSKTACQGFIRRSDQGNKKLPQRLYEAMTTVVE